MAGHTATHPDQSHREGVGHVVDPRILLAVWATLLVLTLVTVGVTRLELGAFAFLVAMIIATVKASLVALYFMHLRYDHPFHAVVLIASLVFVALFIYVALVDAVHYHPTVIHDYEPGMSQ